jgi:hypothetical protein
MVERKDCVLDSSSSDIMSSSNEDLRVPLMATSVDADAPVASAPSEAEEDVLLMTNTGEAESNLSEEESATTLAQKQKTAAGVAGGVIGLLVGGPFLGVVLGLGSLYASNSDGAAGDAARALGDVALLANNKFKEVDNKHQIVEKSKVAAQEAWEKAKQLDRRHRVMERATDFVVWSWEAVKEINRKHRLLERLIEGIGRGLVFVMTKVSENLNPQEGGSSRGDNDHGIPDMTEATHIPPMADARIEMNEK